VEPLLVADRDGWTWIAQVDADRCAWTRLDITSPKPRPLTLPKPIEGFEACGAPRGADVTWRHVLEHAGAGYFLVGDAAAILDPASSNGVIRALMTGMMAVRHVEKIAGGASEECEIAEFSRRVLSWHHSDKRRLSQIYSARFTSQCGFELCRSGPNSVHRGEN
jgi:flavin-dependent dehydrogenase